MKKILFIVVLLLFTNISLAYAEDKIYIVEPEELPKTYFKPDVMLMSDNNLEKRLISGWENCSPSINIQEFQILEDEVGDV